MELWFPLGDWRWLLVALLCVTPGLFCYRREIWDRLGGLLLRIPSSADRTALRENPGNGWRVGRVILQAKTTDEAEALFRDFMAHPDKSREEYAFAAYWLRTCKLRGVNERDCWQEIANAAHQHGLKTGDSYFWDRTIPEVAALHGDVYDGG